jgi:formate-dependent nitrite reductase cytochrome c552 subunit
MDGRDLQARACFRDRSRTIPVDMIGGRRVLFRAIDRRIGGGVDHDVRLEAAQGLQDSIGIRDIERVAPAKAQDQVRLRLGCFLERPGDLPVPSEDI